MITAQKLQSTASLRVRIKQMQCNAIYIYICMCVCVYMFKTTSVSYMASYNHTSFKRLFEVI